MKYREILNEQLKNAPYFKKESIRQLGRQYGLKPTTIDAYVSRSLAHKDIVALKKGMYTTADFYEKNIGDISYTFYLANILRVPSYVSLWTALQYYDLTTDVIAGITSVTPKITRTYKNKAGTFTYHSINEGLFSGSSLVKGKFDFFIATPSKALFDLIYFKTNQFRGFKADMLPGIIDELRIDIDEINIQERSALYAMIKKYLEGHE